ncbi:hypothetical protein MP638_007207 [Amoeboaphelidium occidentale]|nr:hypothetical protein MP638_007207 [Amoeboaphelidium occidentale]
MVEIWYFLKQADGEPFRDSSVDKVYVKSTGDIADLRHAIKAENADADGEPFRDSSVDKVYVKSTGDIADLRHAIKAENADGLLKGISASQLKVFKHNADLDDNPIEVDVLVSDLGEEGTTKARALQVLVPEPNTDDPNKALIDELNMQITDLRLGSDSVQGQLEVSALLVDAPEVEELVNLMNECSQHSDRPYVFIEGSSGEGKMVVRPITFLALVSAKLLKGFTDTLSTSPSCLLTVLKWIPKMLKNQTNMDYSDVFSVKELQNKTLYVYGFMKLLMKTDSSEISAAVVDVKPESFEVVSRMVKSQAIRPFVFLDEFAVVDAHNRGYEFHKLRLMRNSFRAVGFGTTVLGTSTRAVNLEKFKTYGRSDISLWCRVVTKLPKVPPNAPIVTRTLEAIPTEYRTVVEQLLIRGRPWFSSLMARFINDTFGLDGKIIQDLDSIFTQCWKHIIATKRIWTEDAGRHAQAAMYLNASYAPPKNSLATSLIEHHFAILDSTMYLNASYAPPKTSLATSLIEHHFAILDSSATGANFDLSAQLELEPGTRWVPSMMFRSVENEPLLHLIMLGGKDRSGFQESAVRTFENIEATPEARRLVNKYDNAMQISNSGNRAEAILAASICDASHINGLAGVSPRLFVEKLIFHLQYSHLEWGDFTKTFETVMSGRTVPFLAVADQSWPNYLKELPSAKLGTFRRAVNAERMDMARDLWLSGECKDFTKNLPGTEMEESLVRIPQTSYLHVVYTSDLQGTYFNMKRGKGVIDLFKSRESRFRAVIERCGNPYGLECAFCKVQNGKMKSIVGLPSAKVPKCIVLFVIAPP